MCLLIPLKKEHRKNGSIAEKIYTDYLSVAQEDIPVYKILLKKNDELLSPYYEASYKVGKDYKVDFTFADHATSHIGYNRVYDHLVIHKGLHSYATIDAAVEDVVYDNEVVCEFIIPKGSLVFKEGNEVCSNAYRFERVLAYAS